MKYQVHLQADETEGLPLSSSSAPIQVAMFLSSFERRKTCSHRAPILLSEGRAVPPNQQDKRPYTFLFQAHASQSRRGTEQGGGGGRDRQISNPKPCTVHFFYSQGKISDACCRLENASFSFFTV